MSRPPLSAMLTLIAALCILAVIAISSAIPPNDQANPSSRSAGSLGTLALYTWFSDLGLDVGRISGSFDLTASDVVFCYDPTVALTTSDVGARDDVSALAAATWFWWSHPTASPPRLRCSARSRSIHPQRREAASRQSRSRSTAPIASIRSRSRAGLTFSDQAPLVPCSSSTNSVVAGMVRVGTPAARIVLGDTAPLSNDGLRHGDSSFLALSLLQRARGGRISFDEYHHGEGTSTDGAGAIFDGPVGLAALLVGTGGAAGDRA